MNKPIITPMVTLSIILATTAPPTPAKAQSTFTTPTFSAENCVNGRAFQRRITAIRADLARQGLNLPSLAGSVFTADGRLRTAAAGVRAVGTSDEARLGDLYSFGSVGKSWTSLAIGALVDQQRLTFDTPLGSLFPELPTTSPYRDATVRQVIDFQAGLQPILDSAEFPMLFSAAGADPTGLPSTQASDIAARGLFALQPTYPPGTDQQYSNGSFIVAQAIVERLTGAPVQTAIGSSVFSPAGATLVASEPLLASATAPRGHIYEGGVQRPFTAEEAQALASLTFLNGNGINQSAAIGDYGRLEMAQLRALTGDRTGTPLSAATLNEIYSGPPGAALFSGFGAQTTDLGRTIGRLGGTGGSIASSILAPEAGVGAAFFTNTDINSAFEARGGGIVGDGQSPDFTISFTQILPALVDMAGRGVGEPENEDQASVFSSLEQSCASGSSSLVETFGDLPTSDAGALANALAPSDARIAPSTLIASADLLADAVARRLPTADPDERKWTAYALGGARRGHTPGLEGERGTTSASIAGVGIERSLGPNAQLGFVIAAGDADAVLNSRGAEARTDVWQGAIHAAVGPRTGLSGRAMLSFGTVRTRTSRSSTVTGLSAVAASASREGWVALADVEAQFGLDLGGVRLAPFAGVRAIGYQLEAARERSTLGLALDDDKQGLIRVRGGAEAEGTGTIGGWRITPRVRATYVREVDTANRAISATLADANFATAFRAAASDRSFGEARASISATRGQLTIQAGADSRFGATDGGYLGWTAGIGLRF